MSYREYNRRQFLHGTTISVLASPFLLSSSTLGAIRRPGPNDRIRLGLIGPGYRARDLIKESPADIDLVALADCDLRQTTSFRQWALENRPDITRKDLPEYQDYRKMIDREQLDAVMVATTTHARVLICLDAMQAGLDVYAEKPLTLTIEEGQYLVRAEKKFGTVFQTGTQQRSIPINNWGSDLIRDGVIGKVKTVLCHNFLGPEVRSAKPTGPACPPEMNWDMWCHQTDLIPFDPDLHPGLGKWGRWRAYDGGGLGWGVTGWGAHAFDQVQRALGTDDTTPNRVWPEGSGPNCKVSMRYPSGTLLKLELKTGSGPGLGAIFIGEKGKIEINRNRLASNPSELVAGHPEPEDRSEVASVAQRHIQNWVACIRSREQPHASAVIGHRSSIIYHLVNICRELGRELQWDPKKEVFVGDDQANALCSRPRRKGYELPSNV
jgi:predicted dehydrogenase